MFVFKVPPTAVGHMEMVGGWVGGCGWGGGGVVVYPLHHYVVENY